MDARNRKESITTQVKDDYRKSKTWISVTLQTRVDHTTHLLLNSLCLTNCTDKGNESATVASQRHFLKLSSDLSHSNDVTVMPLFNSDPTVSLRMLRS